MPDTIEFRPTTIAPRDTLIHSVALKPTWTDDWITEPYLYAEELTWSCAPAESMATLAYRYGRGRRPGEVAFDSVFRLTKPRYFVRVTVSTNASVLLWYGILEVNGDRLDGTRFTSLQDGDVGIAAGRQSLVCYGLERLLDMHVVRSSTWTDPDGGAERPCGRGLTFNPESRGKRTHHRRARNRFITRADDCFLFAGTDDPAYTANWSTHDVVEYLLARQSPRDWDGAQRIKFALPAGSDEVLPTWDNPELLTQGVRLRALLNSLMPRERLLSYWLDVADDNTILVRPFTFTGTRLELGQDAPAAIAANAAQKIVVIDRDPGVEGAVLKTSTLDQVDQAIAIGARRRTCFTVSHADDTIARGWPADLQAEYLVGASTAIDYPPPAEIDLREIRNTEARAAERLEMVFSRFVIPADWGGFAGNGLGNGTWRPVFPDDADAEQAVLPYPPELHLLRTLPLLDGHNYDSALTAGNVTTTGDGPYAEIPPLVLTPLPEAPTRYVQIEHVGRVDDSESVETEETWRNWSGSVRVPDRDRAVIVRVHGEEQHVLARDDFTLIDESDFPLHTFEWRELLFTVAAEDDRHVEARYPDPPVAHVDALRTIVIDAGEACRLDYLVPDTIVAVNATTGALVRAGGGYLRDDREQLRRVAKLAYQWYSQARASFEFSTSDVTDALWLGHLVTKIGDQTIEGGHRQDVGSCVTSLTLTIPAAEGGSTPTAPRMHYTTAFGELDPLKF